jgi:hypothetical protein
LSKRWSVKEIRHGAAYHEAAHAVVVDVIEGHIALYAFPEKLVGERDNE